MAEMLLMRRQGVGKKQNIVKVDKTKRKISKDLVRHSLDSLGSIPEAKRKAEELKEASWKDHEKHLEPNRSGSVRLPKQGRGAPPAVRRRVEEAGAKAVAVD